MDKTTQKLLRENASKVDYLFSLVVKLLDIKPNEKVLDAGGGIGKLSSFTDCKNVDLIDINEKAVKFAKRLNKYSDVSVGSITNIGKKNKYYDKVCCIETLHYIQEWKATIDELFRVTRKRIIITIPNFTALKILNFWRYKHYTNLEITEFKDYLRSKMREREFTVEKYYSANKFRKFRGRFLASEIAFVIDFNPSQA